MWEACYLLDMGQGQAMIREMEALLDRERLLKYQEAKEGRAKILCLGAGALLRLAWAESQAEGRCILSEGEPGQAALRLLTPGDLVRRLRELAESPEPRYCYGEKGKPYFKDSPLSFSLSHSGELVLCAIADHEIGVDVQKVIDLDWEKLAKRFFSPMECDSLGTDRELFFRLWCRKEAYGKLTGEGAAIYLGQSFLEGKKGIFTREGALSLREETYCYCICSQHAEKLFSEI